VPETHTSSRPASVDPLELPSLLRPSIEAAIAESEIRGDLPATPHAELRDAGAFRLLTPREFGGSETPLTDVLRIYENFGRIDASVELLVWNANYAFMGALLSESGAAQIWSDGAEPTLANSGKRSCCRALDEARLLHPGPSSVTARRPTSTPGANMKGEQTNGTLH
jgi:alkylation response protein AidB-like acyl-CoA dehydrogenase